MSCRDNYIGMTNGLGFFIDFLDPHLCIQLHVHLLSCWLCIGHRTPMSQTCAESPAEAPLRFALSEFEAVLQVRYGNNTRSSRPAFHTSTVDAIVHPQEYRLAEKCHDRV